MEKNIKEKVIDFVAENEDKVLQGALLTTMIVSGFMGYKFGQCGNQKTAYVNRLVYDKDGNVCEKYIIKILG